MSGCYAVFHKQLGDTLLLEPALARLREHHGSPVRLITRSGHEPLVQLMEGVEFQRGVPWVYRSHLYCFDPKSKSAVRSLFAPAGVKHCILPDAGEGQRYHPLLFSRVIVPGLGDRYVAEYFWENVPVPAASAFRPPILCKPDEGWMPEGFEDGPFLLINPTSGWRKKSWVPERWAALIRHLVASTGHRCVMTSGPIDWQVEHCRAIEASAGGAVCSLASGTTLRQFLWLCSRASHVITVDGAASHLAAAFGVRNLTLFGPTNIHNWHRPSASSLALQAPSEGAGEARLKDLSIETVLSAVEGWMRPCS